MASKIVKNAVPVEPPRLTAEYTRYLKYYSRADTPHNFKCFFIWKGFGMKI